jgi:hypothetical protein
VFWSPNVELQPLYVEFKPLDASIWTPFVELSKLDVELWTPDVAL